MKIKNIFESEKIGNEEVMVSLNSEIFSGIIRTNDTASFIISCIKEDTTLEEVSLKLCSKYQISQEQASKAVNKIISQLLELNLIEK